MRPIVVNTKKKKKMGFKSPNPLTNLLIQSPASVMNTGSVSRICCAADQIPASLLSVFLSSA